MSFTEIGRIGSQHTLTSPQDNTLYLFDSAMWCTHPLLGNAFMGGNDFNITAGSNIVTGTSTLFTLLCQDMQIDNVPKNKYIAYIGSSYGILEIDYVLDDLTMILTDPAIETVTLSPSKVSLIDYWGTPILKEVEVRNESAGFSTSYDIANKYSSTTFSLIDYPFYNENEGGIEPMLIASSGSIVILKY